jgi:hypothetical protein
MITKTILLNSIKKVKDFINTITPFEGQADIVSGRYVINAKSIMGIFSIDLANPLELNIHVEDPEEFDIDLSEFEYNPEPEPETPDEVPEPDIPEENP